MPCASCTKTHVRDEEIAKRLHVGVRKLRRDLAHGLLVGRRDRDHHVGNLIIRKADKPKHCSVDHLVKLGGRFAHSAGSNWMPALRMRSISAIQTFQGELLFPVRNAFKRFDLIMRRTVIGEQPSSFAMAVAPVTKYLRVVFIIPKVPTVDCSKRCY